MIAIRLIVPERRARLHRRHDDAVVDKLHPRHMMCRLHRRLDGLGIADRPVIGKIAAILFPDDRRIRRKRARRIRDHGQVFIIDHHEVRRIARLRRRFGHDHRHQIADMAHPVARDQPARRLEDRRAIRVLQHIGSGRIDSAEPRLFRVLAGIDGDDARRRLRIFRVDARDPRMGVGAAHHHRIELARQRDVVREPPLT